MTTVAYRAGVMAADTMATMGDEKAYGAVKLFHTSEYLVGMAGSLSNLLPFRDWLLDYGGDTGGLHRHWDSIPNYGGGFTALLVDLSGTVWNCGGNFPPITLHREFEAIGSGSDFAMAAMECGKSAADAVRVARKFDLETGGQILTIRHP